MRSQHATWKPVPYTGLHGRTPRRAVVLHTNGGGSGSLFGWFSGNARGYHGAENRHVGAQFQVLNSGHAEQYVDTDQVIYHAYSASEWAVGIETEDDGHPATPWTDAQLGTIIAICRELHVPAQLLKDGPSDGVGWHEQYADWNRTAHSCPGKIREQQIRDVIIPALRRTPAPTPPAWFHRLLRVQHPFLSGNDVEIVQGKVGLSGRSHDGKYGPETAQHVTAWQKRHGLAADGVVGRNTAIKMGAA